MLSWANDFLIAGFLSAFAIWIRVSRIWCGPKDRLKVFLHHLVVLRQYPCAPREQHVQLTARNPLVHQALTVPYNIAVFLSFKKRTYDITEPVLVCPNDGCTSFFTVAKNGVSWWCEPRALWPLFKSAAESSPFDVSCSLKTVFKGYLFRHVGCTHT